MTVERTKQVSWLKALTLGAALVVAPIAACATEPDGDVAQNADGLKGGVPNSTHGKGKGNGSMAAGAAAPTMGAAGAVAHGHGHNATDAGVDGVKGEKGRAHMPQDVGQGAAAGATAHGKKPDQTTTTKGGKGKMGAGAGENEADDADDMNDEAQEAATP
jgi:hypothetical protein